MKKDYFNLFLPLLCCIIFLISSNLIFILVSILISSFLFFKKKNFKIYMLSLFLTYTAGLLYFTIFNSFYGREFIGMEWTISIFKNYIKNCNFIPFKTISFFISSFFIFSEQITQKDILLNLVGNSICLIPLTLFVPFFIKKYSTLQKFSLFIIFVSFSIEVIQLITMTGSFDIDDIILNSLGAIYIYVLYHDEINNYLENFEIVKSKKELQCFMLKTFCLLFLVLLIFTLFIIRYYKEKDYWEEFYFDKIELLNNENICNFESHNLIYEDELYEYYTYCDNYENIMIKINENIIKLKDYLEGKTMYPVIMHKLMDTNLIIEKVEKNPKIILCPKESQAVKYNVENNEIIELFLSDYIIDNGEKCSVFSVIPNSVGETNAIFKYDGKEYSYHFSVDTKNIVTITN